MNDAWSLKKPFYNLGLPNYSGIYGKAPKPFEVWAKDKGYDIVNPGPGLSEVK